MQCATDFMLAAAVFLLVGLVYKFLFERKT